MHMSTQVPLKQTIMSGQTVAGAMIFEFFTPGMSNILANAGAKFAIYDMEHTGLGYETLKWLFATCRGLPIEPMVRVPKYNLIDCFVRFNRRSTVFIFYSLVEGW